MAVVRTQQAGAAGMVFSAGPLIAGAGHGGPGGWLAIEGDLAVGNRREEVGAHGL